MLTIELLAHAKDGEGVKSGPIGLAVILLLCVAVYFLFKSMSKHLKRVREEFPADSPAKPADVGPQQAGPGDAAPPQPATERGSSASNAGQPFTPSEGRPSAAAASPGTSPADTDSP